MPLPDINDRRAIIEQLGGMAEDAHPLLLAETEDQPAATLIAVHTAAARQAAHREQSEIQREDLQSALLALAQRASRTGTWSAGAEFVAES